MVTSTTKAPKRIDAPQEPRRLTPLQRETLDPGSAGRAGAAGRVARSPRSDDSHVRLGGHVQAPRAAHGPRGLGSSTVARRMLLGALTAVVSAFLLTAAPLFALWVGSRVQSEVGLTMGGVGVTICVLVLTSLLLYKALIKLNSAYDDSVGRTRPRRQLPWHEPASSRRRGVTASQPLSVIDWIVLGTVVAASLAFGVWFFFLA